MSMEGTLERIADALEKLAGCVVISPTGGVHMNFDPTPAPSAPGSPVEATSNEREQLKAELTKRGIKFGSKLGTDKMRELLAAANSAPAAVPAAAPAAAPAATPAAPVAPATPAPVAAAPAVTAPTAPTVATVRELLLGYANKNGMDAGRALLAKFGASKISDVKESDLPALKAAIEGTAANDIAL